MEGNKEEWKSLYSKMNELRADVVSRDWSKDKNFPIGGRAVGYLSAEKVKKTIAPLVHKHGLELEMKFSELTQMGEVAGFKQHWFVRLDASLVDTDTGLRSTTTVYGESGDAGDKGISKAQTVAIKQWVLTEFLIADGIDPEDEPARGNTFVPKSHEETEEVRSQVLAQTVKTDEQVAAKEEPQKDIPVPQVKAMERIMGMLAEKAGKDTSIDMKAITAEADAVTNQSEAIAFIKKYKELVK